MYLLLYKTYYILYIILKEGNDMNIKTELEILNTKISAAEEGYRCIEKAWCSTKDVSSRIDSLLVLARELRSIEEKTKSRAI